MKKKQLLSLALALAVLAAVTLLILGISSSRSKPAGPDAETASHAEQDRAPESGSGAALATEAETGTPSESAEAEPERTGATTLMIYMVGSDLESKSGAATNDLEEIRQSGIDLSRNTVLVYAGGAMAWHNPIASKDRNTLLRLTETGWEQAEAFEKRSMGESECLTEFLDWCCANAPADHYALILWDHGNGPVMGYGKDVAFGNDRLTLPEMRQAMEASPFSPERKLDWVGFDACLMSSAELCCIWKDYANLLAASQETEPCFGWDYSFLGRLGLCRDRELLCDMTQTYLETCLTYYERKGYAGGDLTLAVLDLRCADRLADAVNALFGAAAPDARLQFDRLAAKRANTRSIGRASTGSEYDLVDLRDLAEAMAEDYPEEAGVLLAAVDEMVLQNAVNAEGLSGLSLYYPFFNKQYYTRSWAADYRELGLFENYRIFLENYTGSWLYEGSPASYTHPMTPVQISDTEFTLQLDEEEAARFASARYYILLHEGGDLYRQLYSSANVTNDNGLLTARFDGNIIYAVSDYGEFFLPTVVQHDTVGDKTHYSVDAIVENNASVYMGEDYVFELCSFHIVLDQSTGEVKINNLLPVEQDAASDEVIGGKLEEPDLSQWSTYLFYEAWHRIMTRYGNGTLMGWSDWLNRESFTTYEFAVRDGVSFAFQPISYGDYALVFEIRDTHGDVYCSEPVQLRADPEPVRFEPKIPAPEPISLEWDYADQLTVLENDSLRLRLRMDPGIFGNPELILTAENLTDRDLWFRSENLTVNGNIQCEGYTGCDLYAYETKECRIGLSTIGRYKLLDNLDSLEMTCYLQDDKNCAYLLFGQKLRIDTTEGAGGVLLPPKSPELEAVGKAAADRQTLCRTDDYTVELVSFGNLYSYGDTPGCILRFENHSDHTLCFDCSAFALNDIYVDAYLDPVTLRPGNAVYCIAEAEQTPAAAEVISISELRLCITVGWNEDTMWLGDGETSWHEVSLTKASMGHKVFVAGDETLYEENGVRIAMRTEEQGGCYREDDDGQYWYLTVENNTDQSISIGADAFSVNGTPTEYGAGLDYRRVGPHQKTILEVRVRYGSSVTKKSPAKEISFIPKIMNDYGSAELWRSDAPLELTKPEN